ncbi:hypothetical protein COCNU_14G007100 [Cocos nucifera]|uniref:Lipoyl-binding domain-containing protein n=1 Tax=Cocos nucifera TaxID=13894 RepID=A0A8K0IV39_COCNU|nr:hypothetical protein COCNU_14G007100 [Cocos nucifera]
MTRKRWCLGGRSRVTSSPRESVVVVESDKAGMNIETFYDGYLAAIMVEEGAVAAVSSAITLLAEIEDEIPIAKSQAASSATTAFDGPAATPLAVKTPSPPSPLETALEVLSSSPPLPSFSPVVASSAHLASQGGRRTIATPYAKKLAKDLTVIGPDPATIYNPVIVTLCMERGFGSGIEIANAIARLHFTIHLPVYD